MGSDERHVRTAEELHYRIVQSIGQRLHILIWVLGAIVTTAVLGLLITANRYLDSTQVDPVLATVMLTGVGASIAGIFAGAARIVHEIPNILEARNNNPAMPVNGRK